MTDRSSRRFSWRSAAAGASIGILFAALLTGALAWLFSKIRGAASNPTRS